MTRLGLFVVYSTLAAAPLAPVVAQDLIWMRHAGTTANDYGYGVAVDGAGNAFLTGMTWGDLGGPHVGNPDVFLAKYDTSGAPLWARHLGTTADEFAYGVAVDGAGNAFIAGYTQGVLGGTNAGQFDAFLTKYDPSGTLLWTRQIGTSAWDFGAGVAVDGAGNAYITGRTQDSLGGPNAGLYDAFLAKFDSSGILLWSRQIGTPAEDWSTGVAVDGAGNAFISGYTEGSLGTTNAGGQDAFLAKYGASGTLLWTLQTGTPANDYSAGVAVDGAGNSFITGYTSGSLGGPNAGGIDAFLAKYNPTGSLLWIRQVGTETYDGASSVDVDGAGNAYISGSTGGSLGGSSEGASDLFLAKYDPSGARLWTRQSGTSTSDESSGVAVDGAGNAYITGTTTGCLGGPGAGGSDAFLIKYSPPFCPADFNHDGFVTGDDFDGYVAAFEAGC